jgi:hypothetical protein
MFFFFHLFCDFLFAEQDENYELLSNDSSTGKWSGRLFSNAFIFEKAKSLQRRTKWGEEEESVEISRLG